MKPYVVCHMMGSLDGRLSLSRWSESPEGGRSEWIALYESVHESLAGDAWIVGRVTMAEMSKAAAHPPGKPLKVDRPHHFASRNAKCYAIALDRSAKLHFKGGDIHGDQVVVLLGKDVSDSHLAELALDGVSYIVAEDEGMELAPLLEVLGRELGIRRLLLEGGAAINGSFFEAGLVDELSLLLAPGLDGGAGSRAIIECDASGLKGKVQLSLQSCERLDNGVVHLKYLLRST